MATILRGAVVIPVTCDAGTIVGQHSLSKGSHHDGDECGGEFHNDKENK
jgi:hypothetical protein